MQLVRAQVAEYKSIVRPVRVCFGQITCLISNTSSLPYDYLNALGSLNLVKGVTCELPETDLPPQLLNTYRERKVLGKSTQLIEAEFLLTVDEFSKLESTHGKGILLTRTFTVRRYYEHDAIYYGCAEKIPLPVFHYCEDYASLRAVMQNSVPAIMLVRNAVEIPAYPASPSQLVCVQPLGARIPDNWVHAELD